MKESLKYGSSFLTIEDYSKKSIWLWVENEGGGAMGTFPLIHLKNLINKFPPQKPTRLETQLYDALERLICELYADGPTLSGEGKANGALDKYIKQYGLRHDGKFEVSSVDVVGDKSK